MRSCRTARRTNSPRRGRCGSGRRRGRDIYIDERTVDVHVGRLRRALNRGRASDPIRTVRGAGYSFDERFGKTA